MLITLIVLAVLNLLMLGYIAWRMPARVDVVNAFVFGDDVTLEKADQLIQKHVTHNFTVGDVATSEMVRSALRREQRNSDKAR